MFNNIVRLIIDKLVLIVGIRENCSTKITLNLILSHIRNRIKKTNQMCHSWYKFMRVPICVRAHGEPTLETHKPWEPSHIRCINLAGVSCWRCLDLHVEAVGRRTCEQRQDGKDEHDRTACTETARQTCAVG